jgi:uncharacterized protein (TIGR00730 family)
MKLAKKKKGVCVPNKKNQFCKLPKADSDKNAEPPKLNEITWRIFRIMSEFVEGFQFLSESSQEVTFFGSARLKPSTKYYKEAEKLGRLLAKKGYTVTTGGGPGIMEAGNKGAAEAGGVSIGLNIQLPNEQRVNKYVNKSHAFHYFFTRKVMLSASAQAYVYFPGGFGTLDEFFEIITLIQTKKMDQIPVVVVGKEFWQGLFDWVDSTLVKNKTISKEDLDLFTIVDTAEEAMKIISKSTERTFF